MQLNHRYREFCSRLDKAILKHHYGIFLEAAPRGFTLAA